MRWQHVVVVVVVAFVACKKADNTYSAKPTETGSGSGSAGNTAGVSVGSGSGSAPATGPCKTPSYFASAGACKAGGRCLRIFEVTPACTVREVNELAMGSLTEEIYDIVWPKVDGALYVAAKREDGDDWMWGAIDKPRTATDAELAAIKWKAEKLGNRGYDRFGLETDGARVILTSCDRWIDDNEEEWHCGAAAFRTIDGGDIDKLPPPAFAKPWAAGEVVPGVSLRKKRRALECRIGTGKWEDTYQDVPIGYAPIDGDRYYLLHKYGGHRADEIIGIAATAMKGCALDPAMKGEVIPGPNGLRLNRAERYSTTDNQWKVYRSDTATPLFDGAGVPFALEQVDTLVWAR